VNRQRGYVNDRVTTSEGATSRCRTAASYHPFLSAGNVFDGSYTILSLALAKVTESIC